MRVLLMTVTIFLSTMLFAQNSNPAKPCSAPEYRQLDFWVGDWDLTWPGPAGQPQQQGRNRIDRELNDCVIHEHFSDQAEPPFQGTSISLYSSRLHKWQQTWVDNQGMYLDFTGEFQDGQMILARDAVGKDGKAFRQRMVFKNIKPDSFDWSWERSDDGGATWKVMWPIHYQRRKL